RHPGLAAEHVASFPNLVEDLVGGYPHKIGVHELHDRLVATGHRQPSTETGKGVFTNRRTEYPVRVLILEPAGSPVSPAFEPVHILSQDNDTSIRGHATIQYISDGVDEAPRNCRCLAVVGKDATFQARFRADSLIDQGRIRPQV